MEEYLQACNSYNKHIIYDFHVGCGGIGDCIKYYMLLLNLCIQYKYRLYYLIQSIPIESYLRLKHPSMYIQTLPNSRRLHTPDDLHTIGNNTYAIVEPSLFYSEVELDTDLCTIPFQDVFDFAEEVKLHSKHIMPPITNYISIHLRMGDKYLETDKTYVQCKQDTRDYVQERLFQYIEQHSKESLVFFCDNGAYKQMICKRYNFILVTSSSIGHTGLRNTSPKQILDAITEFYLMTQSKQICAVSKSGFSSMASKFGPIPLETLY